MNTDVIVSFVNSAGPLGPLAYIFVQILQTIIAPIPGNVVGAAGGFLFGIWGILWTTIGSTVGVFIVLLLTRKYGRKIVMKLTKKKSLGRFDKLEEDRAGTIFFLLFLIPGLPDDIVSYAAGLSKIPIPKLLVLWVIGRMPAVVMTNYIGMGIEEGALGKTAILLGISALVVGFVAIKSKEIIDYLTRKLGKK
ncbi:TVP38/TMEM64 family protein [Candidatus Saccharibacteria bacterium]|nr:TVP38/TMEM64 family protein [Candidatus Saccharibacteria bacterium]